MKDFPHKAIIRIIVDYFPLMQTGELNPLASSQKCIVLNEIYGKNLEECINNTEKELDIWKNKKKN